MGKRFSLTELANEQPFVPPAYSSAAPWAASTPEETPADVPYRHIEVTSIALNPLNERPEGDDEDIAGLADTLRDYGVIQPLLVCSAAMFVQRYPNEADDLAGAEWVVLIGNRRLRAARHAGLDTVPAIVNDEQLATMYRAMLIENLQHQAMPPVHEAEAMSKAMSEERLSQSALAEKIGKTQGFISQRLSLLKLIPELRLAVNTRDLPVELARGFGDLTASEQREIAAAGPPYRRRNDRAGETAKRGWSSSPGRAATTIGKRFTNPDDLAELIRLLNDQLSALRDGSPHHDRD